MTDANEQSALEKIKEHLGAGYTMDEIRSAGWGEWIDYFGNKGIDFTGSSDTAPAPASEPQPEPAPDPVVSAASDPKPVASATPDPAMMATASVAAAMPRTAATANDNVKKMENALDQDPKTIALIGKAIGVGVVVLGLVLALWTAIDLGDFADTSDQIRSFLSDALSYTAFGSLVFLAAVIFERVSTPK